MLESLTAIATLIILEGILSVDNALAMALQVKSLEPQLQRRALLYGMWGALILRGVAILGAKWLMNVWWLQAAGALYLLYLAITHFALRGEPHQFDRTAAGPRGFWATIAMVELTDAAFALDSILVAVGIANQLWVVFTGVALGILAVRYAAVLFLKLLEYVPQIEHLAFVMMGWVAIRLLSEGWEEMSTAVLHQPYPEHILPEWFLWSGVAALLILGGLMGLRANLLKKNGVGHFCRRLIGGGQALARRFQLPRVARRIIVLIIGTLVLVVGLAMIFLPGPAFIVIPAGLAILATEFKWARRLLDKGRAGVRRAVRLARSF